ncbi:P-selectin isoform X1, partial [Pelobates cultripes]
ESSKAHIFEHRASYIWKCFKLLWFAAAGCGFLQIEVSSWTYHASPIALPWNESRMWCKTKFTDLVAIQNKEEIVYLNRTFPKHNYWIGIRKINKYWTWVGTNKTLTKEEENWASGEPNNKGEQQDCVEIYIKREKDSGKWNDDPCRKQKKGLCYQANCNASSCSGHGECVETIGHHTCNCIPGFFGPACEHVVTCDSVQEVPKASVSCRHPFGQFAYSSSCLFQCDAGFQLNGSSSIECSKHGNWTYMIPQCEAVACEALKRPSDGSMACSHPFADFRYNSSCTFGCVEGFLLEGPESVLCQATGEWSNPAPTCAAVACEPLKSPSNGSMTCSNVFADFHFKSSCTFGCIEGFVLNGSESVLCQAVGEWSDPAPTCAAVACEVLKRPSNGSMTCSHPFADFHYNSSCTFRCAEGFVLEGPESVRCQATGDWSDLAPTCAAVACEALKRPSNGSMTCSQVFADFHYNSSCTFGCAEGFVLEGPESVLCQATGEWSDPAPTCAAVACESLERPSNGSMTCSHPFADYCYNSSCTFGCVKGFVLEGPESVLCQATGDWSDPAPTCAAVVCEAVKRPSNGSMTCSHVFADFHYNSSCTFSCVDGFVLEGPESVLCQASGEWSDPAPTCAAVACEALKRPSNGSLTCSNVFADFRYDSSCSFSCAEGFVLEGSETAVCQATGEWSDPAPTCAAVTCEALKRPSNGSMTCSHAFGDFRYNANCSFNCANGFVLEGSESVMCQATGEWSDPSPTCAAVLCLAPEFPSYEWVNCSHPIKNFSYTSVCIFACKPGFTLNGSHKIECTSSGVWNSSPPICQVLGNQLTFGKQLYIYLGGSVAAVVCLIGSGIAIAIMINKMKPKKKNSFLMPQKISDNTFENPTFDIS